jgi:toxin ParE1/3/4
VRRVALSKNAERDLDGIFWYWAERASIEAAERTVDSILDRFTLLAKFPEIGRHSDEICDGLLRISAGEYVIYFRKLPRVIRIMHVLHGARDQKRGFRPG